MRAGYLLMAAAVVASLGLAAGAHLDRWVVATRLPPLAVATGTEVLARDGSLLRAFPVADGRWRLAPGAVDPGYIAMLTAYEDRRFARHGGVDPRAFLRAAGQAVLRGRVVSGGSTLTMQVARLLEDGPTGRWDGKLRQIRVALALERRLDKAAIVGLYLRLAPYGGNLEGIRAASLSWFGKPAARLTPAEAALLVALPQSPAARRPDRFPEAARAARDRVLARAEAAGVIDAATALAARTEPLPRMRRPFPALAPHLTARLGRGAPPGAQIATTIDPGLQRQAEHLAARAVTGQPARASAALILADHRTGEILAQVGGAQWTDAPRAGFLDLSRATRSPGSTLKPFVYGLAFEDGIAHPDTLIEDTPATFGQWRPVNFDRQFRGTVPVARALQLSLNIPAVRLTEAVGPARLMALMARAGTQPALAGGAPGLAIALGGVGLTLENLTAAYAGLAAGGRAVALSPLPGAGGPGPARLLGEVAAWQVGHVLAAIPPPSGAPAGQIAWKTGTSYGHRDAWALGYDGRLVAGVWLGRADGTPLPGAFGGDLAAPVLFDLFDAASDRRAPLPPPPAAALPGPNAALPLPLQRFRPPGAALSPRAAAPMLVFPPDGAEIEVPEARLLLRIDGGEPPFTVLADGAPMVLAAPETALEIPVRAPGFLRLTVIDAAGQSDSAAVRLR